MATRTWIGTTSGDWNVTTNWVEGSVPVTGDDAVFRNNAVNVDTTLNQSAVTLASLTIESTYTGTIGTSAAYLQIGATLVTIGATGNASNPGAGSSRIKLNLGSVQSTVTVVTTNQAGSDNLEPVLLIGTHSSNKLYVLGGRVGVATVITSAVATLAEFDVSGNGVLNLAAGCTLTTGYLSGNATASVNSAMTTLTQTGGTLNTSGSGAITTVNLWGTANLNSTGTVTTLNVYPNGSANFAGNPAARTVTTLNLYSGGKFSVFTGNPAHLTITTFTKVGGGTLMLSA